MNYYIADTHFGHKNIIRLSNRPFSSVEEMDRAMMDNWNNVVKDNDDVYILGDLCYKSSDPLKYLESLKGKKHLIIGNHDSHLLKVIGHNKTKYFEEIKDILTVNDNGIQIVLFHYPMVEWNGYYRDTLHFYGHVHNTFHNDTTAYASRMKNAYNVGVDVIGFVPKTLKQIIAAN